MSDIRIHVCDSYLEENDQKAVFLSESLMSPLNKDAHSCIEVKSPLYHQSRIFSRNHISGQHNENHSSFFDFDIRDESGLAPHRLSYVPKSNSDIVSIPPKVKIPFKSEPGAIPRRVVINRLKLAYEAEKIDLLLLERGLRYDIYKNNQNHITGKNSKFELETFDDTSFETHGVKKWISQIRYGNRVTAKVLLPKETGCSIQAGYVLKDDNNNKFQCLIEQQKISVHPMYVCITGEDPINFCNRIAAAHKYRNLFESFLQYNTFLQHYPKDKENKIPAELLERISNNCSTYTEKSSIKLSYLSFWNKLIQRFPKKTETAKPQALADNSRSYFAHFDHVSQKVFQDAQINFQRTQSKIQYLTVINSERKENLSPNEEKFINVWKSFNLSEFKEHVDFNKTLASKDYFPSLTRKQQQRIYERFTQSEFEKLKIAQRTSTGHVLHMKSDEELYIEAKSRIENAMRKHLQSWRPRNTKEQRNKSFAIYETKGIQERIHTRYYKKSKKVFKRVTLYSHENIYSGERSVVSEIQSISSRLVFNLNTSLCRLPDFENQQTNQRSILQKFLKESWIPSIKGLMKSSVKDIGKGWYNLNERDFKIYSKSKLKKLLTKTSLLMQDTLRDLVTDSFQKFKELIVANCSDENPAIFKLACSLDPKIGVTTAIHLDDIPKRFKILLLESLTCFFTLPTLESELMDQFFQRNGNEKRPSLAVISNSDPFVVKTVETVHDVLLKQVSLLKKKIHLEFDQYRAFLEAEVHEIANSYTSDSWSKEAIATALKAEDDAISKISQAIPNELQVGLFTLKVSPVRDFLINKHSSVKERILKEYSNQIISSNSEILKQFTEIKKKVLVDPKDVADCVSQKEYLEKIPQMAEEFEKQIEESQNDYGFLEDQKYKLTQGEFDARWALRSQPNELRNLLDVANEELKTTQEKYFEAMKSDQLDFQEDMERIDGLITEFSKKNDISNLNEILTTGKLISNSLTEFKTRSMAFNENESLFETEMSDYSHVQKMTKDFEVFDNVWTKISGWKNSYSEFMSKPFIEIDGSSVRKQVVEIERALLKSKTTSTVKANPGLIAVITDIGHELTEFHENIPLIEAFASKGIRPRHYDAIEKETGIKIESPDILTLSSAISELYLLEHSKSIIKVGECARKEYQIETALDTMLKEWKELNFCVVPYRETGTYVLKDAEEIIAVLDEHRVMTQAMQFSAFKKPFEDRISEWDKKLGLISEILEEWLQVQRTWLYLHPIFDSPDILKQLPVEGKKFGVCDKAWKTLMKKCFTTPNCLEFTDNPSLLVKFKDINSSLEIVQKGLSDYLDTKRKAFPRFYFLSNDELLQILSQTKDVEAVQPHLKKCFDNIHRLKFEENKHISAMISSPGEVFPFITTIDPTVKSVEFWLKDVEEAMKESGKIEISKSIQEYPNRDRIDFVMNSMGQCAISACMTMWTFETEASLKKGVEGMKEYLSKLQNQLSKMVEKVRGDLTKLQRLTMGALIVLDVHNLNTIQRLVDEKVSSIESFEWISQMRYYMDPETKHLVVKMVQSEFGYGYEYLGNTGRLVITPLTERCYMTLMGALQLNLGGAPAGPAGTGKTETVKDLAKALAKQCVVFNCSDALDHIAMGKFFTGMASSGAWACFDEFNRIDIEVLSVVAQQIQTIWNALKMNQDRLFFEGQEINLEQTTCCFITMNPGYAGRTELPDNLKALFRPVAMMVPNYALIAEIMLYSYGFNEASGLAVKMVSTFTLCSEQLSSQDHYDYGMRAVKTVITQAGNLKREFPEESEDLLLLRALCDANVPKFLKDDLPLFEGIMSDLFPGKKQIAGQYDHLNKALSEYIHEQKLIPHQEFTKKVIQLYETILVRHGLMLVGPTTGGKTETIRALQSSITACKGKQPEFETVQVFTMNPKAVTMGELYGSFDDATHEWEDGILATVVRKCAEDQSPDRKWVVFDGPVDAIWIENMNTVLDDNKKLCLNSGEIIQLSPTMTMIFEVEDLAVASPATVSRCGMVYLDPDIAGHDHLVDSWLLSFPKEYETVKERVKTFAKSDLLLKLIDYSHSELSEVVPTARNNNVQSFLNMIDALTLKYIVKTEGIEDEQPNYDKITQKIDEILIFSIIWSFGATVTSTGREKFEKYFRNQLPDEYSKKLPMDVSLYDVFFDVESQKWTKWMDISQKFAVTPGTDFSDIVVPTNDTTRYTWLLSNLVKNLTHTLFTGPTGTGKTITISRFLRNDLKSPEFLALPMMFSAATTAKIVQQVLESKLDTKRRTRVYGPPLGSKYVVFIDDMNMPAREEYFAQPPIEFLRQWMDLGGWWKSLQFHQMLDLTFACAMGPPGGGRNPITPRFLRHFNIIALAEFDNASLELIFGSILTNCLSNVEEEILSNVTNITKATISIYRNCLKELLPTPSKSHYTFNLRDLSSVFQGLLSPEGKSLNDLPKMLRLWIHEIRRVFQDRLVNTTDRDWFDRSLDKSLKTHFESNLKDVTQSKRIVWGNFVDPESDSKNYEEVVDFEALKVTMNKYLEEYNTMGQPMNLVLFMDAIEHVSRISRVLAQPGGNAFLLGVGGSGRQSLTKLAAHMAEFEVFQIQVSSSYGSAEFREDLRSLCLKCGLEGKDVVFLFCDTQIIEESFLEDINNILNSGETPGLFAKEDYEEIYRVCRIDCQRKKITPSKLNIFNEFLSKVKKNLRIVLCFSPVSSTFSTRLRMFPSLVNCCTIDWFMPWPSDALEDVATSIFAGKLKENMEKVVSMCVYMHQNVERESISFKEELRRENHVTPTSYLELLGAFSKILKEKTEEVGGLRHKLQTGVNKLVQTAIDVEELQKVLEAKQPVLKKTQGEVEELMKKIEVDKLAAEEVKKVVSAQSEAAEEKAAQCKEIKDDAQADLDKALPALKKAVESLSKLKKSDLDEVRAFKNPPAGVKITMEVSCIMFQVPPVKVNDPNKIGAKINDYWQAALKKLLADSKKFLQMLMTYDKDNIPEKVIENVTPYIEQEGFQPKEVAKSSKACTAICMWAHAMHLYYHISRDVEPKRQKLKAAEEELKKVQEELEKAKSELSSVEEKLGLLEKEYDEAISKKEKLAKEVEECSVKLVRAQKLIGGLGGEKDRWCNTVQQLNIAYDSIVGDVLIAAGAISYHGAFTGKYRQKMAKDWNAKLTELGIMKSKDSSMVNTLGNAVLIREWNLCGLPTDVVSIENGIIINKSRRWPLCIDPQGQANKFLKKLAGNKASNGFDVVKLTDGKTFTRAVENAIRFGKWIILENIMETLDSSLEPILQQSTFVQKGQKSIRLGDTILPYNDDFKFYVTTKLPNPSYPPELQVKVTLLNFTITPQGLRDQMLGLVVAKESPELEQKKSELVVSNAQMMAQLQQIEDQILKLLAESKGDILDDEALINTLSSSKKTAEEINVRVKEAKIVEQEIDTARSGFIPVSFRASILYFCVADLVSVDPMYQFSLQWFVQLFLHGIENSTPSSVLSERLQHINSFFTYSFYESVCRSLFERHKIMFSFLLCIKILEGEGKINFSEWKFLVQGGTSESDKQNPLDFLPDICWRNLTALDTLESYESLSDQLGKEEKYLSEVYQSSTPHKVALPEKWEDSLSNFQKLLIVKAIRKDKMKEAIQDFVSKDLGRKFIEPPPFDLEKSYNISKNSTPLIFILSPGADPAQELLKFAEEKGKAASMKSISLGKGQGPIAAQFIAEAKESGSWVLLQNCHLSVSWLPDLEKICERILEDPSAAHPEFRLWLSSAPTPKFPVSILQNGVKMTNEPAEGIRANLLKSYSGISDDFFNSSQKPEAFKKLLFGLCFFHALILERKKFGSLGFNIPYEFREDDLEVCISQTRDYLAMFDEIPFEVLHFLTYDINYGGRVTDDIDRRCLKNILDTFITENLLDEKYVFSKSGTYHALKNGSTHEDYIKYIESFELIPKPEIFGLHDNAEITYASETTDVLFATISDILPRNTSSGGKSWDDIVDETADGILQRVPEVFDIDAVKEHYPTDYSQSMNTVLVQEAIRYNRLLNTMKTSLTSLRRALKGEVVMDQITESIGHALYSNQVPTQWESVAYPSLMNLASWIDDLLKRIQFIQKWIDDNAPNVFWISGFFFPQAFLTGTLQNYARKHVVPIDAVSFDFKILDTPEKDITSPPEDGCYIRGLYMEGARWDEETHSIQSSHPKELFCTMPVIHLIPKTNFTPSVKGSYKCPVYKDLTRRGTLSTTGHSTNFVFNINVPSVEPDKVWIKAGVAMFCALRY